MSVLLQSNSLTSLADNILRPSYDRSSLSAGILHFGVGNFHRAHMGVYLDRLFQMGEALDWAIVGAGVREADAQMRNKLKAQDWLTTVVELDPDALNAHITGSMIDFLEVDADLIVDRMCDKNIRIVSMTVTEGGYYIDAATGKLNTNHADIKADMATPDSPRTLFGMIIKALRIRHDAGIAPFTVLSCDNLPSNGKLTKQTVVELASGISKDVAQWIECNVAFPNAMVDCITPATSDRERTLVKEQFGIEDKAPVICESFRQWVIEDNFPNGRPPFELVGVEFVSDVEQYELMKLRILNAGHASIAYAAALLGYHYVHDAMKDKDIKNWLEILQLREAIPTLSTIDSVDFEEYLNKVILRFANPKIGDTIPRLAAEGSDRQPKFIIPTLLDALDMEGEIDGLAIEIALWCRYCMGTTEAGEQIFISDHYAEDLFKDSNASIKTPIRFLENRAIFGSLSDNSRFVTAFSQALGMILADGVRSTIRQYAERHRKD